MMARDPRLDEARRAHARCGRGPSTATRSSIQRWASRRILGGPAAREATARAASLVAPTVDASRPASEHTGGVRAQALILRRRALAQRDALRRRDALTQRDALTLNDTRARAEMGSRDRARDFEFGAAVRAAARAPVALAADTAQVAVLLASPGAADRRANAAA
jgi:hypothetical protein